MPIGPGWLTHAVDDITALGGVTVLSLLTEAVRTWYRHNRVTPTERETELLCSAAVDLFSQGH
ncbi:hypothetical protein AB9E26_36925, partial [Rhizobium leguminosarum]